MKKQPVSVSAKIRPAVRAQYIGELMKLDISAGSTLFLLSAWADRERRGAEWCDRRKIGPLRALLKNPPEAAPDAVLTKKGGLDIPQHLRETSELLALHCTACKAACGGCRWADIPP